MNATNPICQGANYQDKVYKIFPNLLALDGNRKNVEMNYNMLQAMPEEEKIEYNYDTSETAWFDNTGEIDDPNQAMATRFEPSTNTKREENQLKAILKDCKELIAKKQNILTY